MILIRSIRGNGRPASTLFLRPHTLYCFSTSSCSAAAVEAERSIRDGPRNNWTRDQIKSVYDSPILDLLFHGAQVHRHAHNFREVQQCTLLSVKTGGCSEDCSYCPQSSRYDTGVKSQKLMNKDAVLDAAQKAKEAGSTRFCMGAAWRDTIGRKTNFKQILEYVKEIRGMGMEVCCTLGMIEKQQAEELKKAGLTAYNHNLDTSREYYPNIITTRSYDERLETLKHVREAGINVCSGGIIGLGEAEDDRVGLLHTLATLPTHPESVPINALLAMKGTPLEDQKPVEIWEMIRMIGTARITMPKAMVRLSAGRVRFSIPEQALCFLAGANSIFTGDKLLTTPNNDFDADQQMFKILGLLPKAPDFSNDEEGKDLEAENCDVAVSVKNLCSASRAFYISCSSNYKISAYSFGINKGRRFSSTNYPNICCMDDGHAHSHTQSIQEITFGEDHHIFESDSLQHWFKNWQEQRKYKLTASTFAGAIGLWPRRRVQLWLEKIGKLKPFTGNEATCWNNVMEEEALERYKLITGNTVLFPEFQIYKKTDPEDDWLAASPDGMVDKFVYELPSQGVLEIKCPYFNGDMRKASPWTRIPLHYISQAQGLLEILDRDWMDFYVWTPRGSSLFRVYRDDVYWNLMKIALSDFWWNHVEPARYVCLKSVITEPLYELRSYRPSPKHELAITIVYESKRLIDEAQLLMREINGKLVD